MNVYSFGSYFLFYQGVIQVVFEIGKCFWAHENWRPNFEELRKYKVFTKPLINKHSQS